MNSEKRLMGLTTISVVTNLIMGLYKIGISILSNSVLIFIYSFYNFGVMIIKITFMKNYKKESEKYYLVGLIVVITSICYIFYSVKMLMGGLNPNYHEYMAIAIAAVTFWDIGMAICGIVKARKKNDIKLESLKLTSLASSLISLNLTQIAIFSFKGKNYNYVYNGAMGIGLGLIAMCIGIYMIFYIKKNIKKEKLYLESEENKNESSNL